jgi:hypothetical protein
VISAFGQRSIKRPAGLLVIVFVLRHVRVAVVVVSGFDFPIGDFGKTRLGPVCSSSNVFQALDRSPSGIGRRYMNDARQLGAAYGR